MEGEPLWPDSEEARAVWCPAWQRTKGPEGVVSCTHGAEMSARLGNMGALIRSPAGATKEWTGGEGWGNEHKNVFEGPFEQVRGDRSSGGRGGGDGDGDSREHILFPKTRGGRARAYRDGNMGCGDQKDNRGKRVTSRMKALREGGVGK